MPTCFPVRNGCKRSLVIIILGRRSLGLYSYLASGGPLGRVVELVVMIRGVGWWRVKALYLCPWSWKTNAKVVCLGSEFK